MHVVGLYMVPREDKRIVLISDVELCEPSTAQSLFGLLRLCRAELLSIVELSLRAAMNINVASTCVLSRDPKC